MLCAAIHQALSLSHISTQVEFGMGKVVVSNRIFLYHFVRFRTVLGCMLPIFLVPCTT